MTGVLLALDWGRARIGVAACDPNRTLAFPIETITNASDVGRVRRRLKELVAEYEPVGFVVGLPRHLVGVEGQSAEWVRGRAAWLASRFKALSVRLVDERLTTVEASRQLREAGRDARAQRSVIDQAAAVAILTHALEVERNTGLPAGELISTGRIDS